MCVWVRCCWGVVEKRSRLQASSSLSEALVKPLILSWLPVQVVSSRDPTQLPCVKAGCTALHGILQEPSLVLVEGVQVEGDEHRPGH